MRVEQRDSSASWPRGDGEMACRIRALDWAATPLGSTPDWPQSLRTAVEIMLAVPGPCTVLWGPAHVQLYNDAYVAIAQHRHPALLGRPVAEGWSDAFETVIAPLLAAAQEGRSTRLADYCVPLRASDGRLEDRVFDTDWSPLRDETGAVAGALQTLVETTERRRAEATLRESETRQAFLLKLSDELRPLIDPVEIQAAATRVLGEHLRATRVAYVLVTDDEYIIERDYVDGVASMAGRLPIKAYGPDKLAEYREGKTRIVRDTAADARNDAAAATNLAAVGARAGLGVPLIKGDRFVAALIVHKSEPHDWTQEEVALAEETAERTWAAVERARAVAAMRESEEKHRTLFETMGQGCVEVEVVRDAEGRAIDYRYLELNAAFERLFAIPVTDAKGRKGSEVFPGLEPIWHEAFDRIVRRGEPERLEYHVASLDRWFVAFAYPQGGDRLIILSEDVTAHKRAEAALQASEDRQTFLLTLSDALRPLGDPLEIEGAACRLLGKHLGVARAYYVDTDEAAGTARIGQDWTRPGTASQQGVYRLADFGWAMTALRRDGGYVIPDTHASPLIPSNELPAMDAFDTRAVMGAASIKGDRMVGALLVTDPTPRAWSLLEQSLLQDVGERIWAAVERARAEAALRDSEERFRTLAETIEDVFYITDLDHETLEYLSPSYERVWGRPAADLHEELSRFADTIHEDDRAAVAQALARQARGEAVLTEYRIRRPNGEVRHILDRSFPVPGAEGRRSAGVASDITERKRAEAIVRESEEMLRQFGEASSDVLWIRDARTLDWVYLSPAFETIYGLPRDEALKGDTLRNWADLILPEDRERAVGLIRRVGEGERVVFEYRVRRPSDGEMRWIRNTDFPILDEAGAVAQIGGAGQDVTRLKAAEAAVAASEARLRVLMEGIPQLVWRSADAGRWTWASPQWTAFTSLSSEASRGLGWLDAVHPDDHAGATTAWINNRQLGHLDVEYRVRRASDGAWIWHHTRAAPVQDGDGGITEWLGTSTDVQELKELQASQAVLVAELQHRTRNLITVVRSIASQTVTAADSLASFKAQFNDRLGALARIQGLLSRADEEPITIEALIRMEMEALGVRNNSERVTLQGPAVGVRHSVVQTLSLALHELATNALKYGALAADEGSLSVLWRVSAEGEGRRLILEWAEHGKGDVAAPVENGRRGYGRELIERALPYALGADTRYELHAEGVHCTIDMPLERVSGRRLQ